MDQHKSDMAELEPSAAAVHIRSTIAERVIFTALAVAFPIAVPWLAIMNGVAPVHGVIGGLVVGAIPLAYTILAYRFEVRADCREVFHRGEFVTRRIPLEQIERIRVASETERGGFWSYERTKIEILGNGTRILIACRSNRLIPFVDFLERRFPHLIEDANSLPDV
ncbi:MAG: hypothetical protein RIB58_04905 [Phycisphaerales bacterium]